MHENVQRRQKTRTRQAVSIRATCANFRYVHVPVKPRNSATGFAAQNLPMVAMFMRNKPLAWSCLLLAVQSYLNEPLIKSPDDEAQPAIFKVVFAVISVLTSYMDLVFPNTNPQARLQKPAPTEA
ncbi:hypothetical protein KL906_000576 [Ogataea polymorpha]|nr:hypothetical protein KL937_002970 [Ogataea polymorpha]KAG7912372.1 hypothetical protein KL906_000576 [Ogataea polymorpha]KAG7937969.1 hypothetical protein KL904_002116 [Ogataea polymorpha]KAG7937972.1 hypothetical protein KL934_000546 [Ogataea polymorpha]